MPPGLWEWMVGPGRTALRGKNFPTLNNKRLVSADNLEWTKSPQRPSLPIRLKRGRGGS